MKYILAISLFASVASAFAPPTATSTNGSSSSSAHKTARTKTKPNSKGDKSITYKNTGQPLQAFEGELGAQPPLGFFDPLGLVADGDQAKFDRLRFVELKHGRISMLAVVGYLIQEAGVRLPGNIDYSGTSFSDIRNGFAAFQDIPSGGVAQLVLFVGFLELAVMKDITGGDFIGDFRNESFDLGWDSFDPETQQTKRAIELNQGRAAMMGILALMVHEQLGVSLIPQLP
mmetsp:Transcript_33195/g.37744  ORF Transcript_33195/g.37744 Transcript_33195/m.37744 type:complete len:230 (+) Transcript_33195:203-892(+)|eukprot:CAMPEP_0194146592 /NCGR_PEP_ID=MMETSP0152-20130528/20967_1 /TAXON_ID=1049557 /ORGANISM="Thalassiothrix antarctica, Strain L6-D1" /LENGTH=229 /DNA_ID=CAMNT_0038847143 /DNA_START=33 /DNA_END=722 /DNA_ORIENTATION=+